MNMLLDRLTEAIQNGIVKYKIRKGACAVDCVEKLGLYEDIGLLPEQVKQLKKEKEEREKMKCENCTNCVDGNACKRTYQGKFYTAVKPTDFCSYFEEKTGD